MATIVLYKINERVSFDNNTLLTYQQTSQRDVFFSNVTIQETISSDLTPSFVKKLWDLETTLTIYLEGRNPLSEYNYISIEENSFVHYYFIMGYDDLGSNQVRYFLRKDTLNTYTSRAFWGVDIEGSNALVNREHKNRFIKLNNQWSINIDRTIEGLNLQSEKIEEVKQIGGNDRTQLTLRMIGGDMATDLDTGYTYLLSAPKLMWSLKENEPRLSTNSSDFVLKYGWGVKPQSGIGDAYFLKLSDANNPDNYLLVGNIASNEIVAFVKGSILLISEYSGTRIPLPASKIFGSGGEFSDYKISSDIENLYVNADSNTVEVYYDLGNHIFSTFPESLSHFKKFTLLYPLDYRIGELTDNTVNYSIQKTVELPYKLNLTNLKTWGTGGNVFFDVSSDINFLHMNYSIEVPNFSIDGPLLTLKRPLNDPKIYNKEFQPRFLTFYNESFVLGFDSFNRLTNNHGGLVNIRVKLNVADYSKIKVNLYSAVLSESSLKEFTKVIDMNNEVSSFSTNYDRYIQTTLENDIKLMRLQESQAQRQLSKRKVDLYTNTVIGSLGAGIINPAAGVGVAATGAVKMFTDVKFAMDQMAEDSEKRRIDFENKILNLQNGLINIAGSSPEQNRLGNDDKFKDYKLVLTDSDLNYLDQYFHKFGYKTMEYKKPTLRTRQYFNYLELEFEELKSSINLTREVKEDIINRFKNGVTAFHYQVNTTWKFDFDQKYENWELN